MSTTSPRDGSCDLPKAPASLKLPLPNPTLQLPSPTSVTPPFSPHTSHPTSTTFAHQVAGHDELITLEGGKWIVKPVNDIEVEFYQTLSNLDQESTTDNVIANSRQNDTLSDKDKDALKRFKRFIPGCDGVVASSYLYDRPLTPDPSKPVNTTKPPPSRSPASVLLRNIVHPLTDLHITDLKIGSVLTGPDITSQEKIERMKKVSEGSTSGSLGVRMTGCKIYRPNLPPKLLNDDIHRGETGFPEMEFDDDGYFTFPRQSLRMLQPDLFKQVLETFFWPKSVVGVYLDMLDDLIESVQAARVRCFSASLLLVHGKIGMQASTAPSHSRTASNHSTQSTNESLHSIERTTSDGFVVRLALIDFGHSWIGNMIGERIEGPDENMLKGLRNLREILTGYLEE